MSRTEPFEQLVGRLKARLGELEFEVMRLEALLDDRERRMSLALAKLLEARRENRRLQDLLDEVAGAIGEGRPPSPEAAPVCPTPAAGGGDWADGPGPEPHPTPGDRP